jgi:hypothetical protein
MRLHILLDEKIVMRAIRNFERVFPNDNKYVVLSTEDNAKCKHVDVSENCNIFVRKYDSPAFWKVIGDVSKYSYVIIHFMSDDSARFVNKIEHDRIAWIEWGGDMYNVLLAKRGFKLYRDEKLVINCKQPKLPYTLYKLLRPFIKYDVYLIHYKAVKKCKYFIPDSMEGEYELLLNYFPEFSHLERRSIFYYPIHEILGNLSKSLTSGGAIMVGNSASYTNNHPYILDRLHECGFNGLINMPLSYPKSTRYVHKIINYGKNLFGEQFVPITDYMSLEQYNKLMLSVNSFIYGNLRQEAVGNILIALYIGGRVFLEKTNPLYSYYLNKGLIIYSIEEMTNSLLVRPMQPENVARNRQILDELYSNDRLENLIKESFGTK